VFLCVHRQSTTSRCVDVDDATRPPLAPLRSSTNAPRGMLATTIVPRVVAPRARAVRARQRQRHQQDSRPQGRALTRSSVTQARAALESTVVDDERKAVGEARAVAPPTSALALGALTWATTWSGDAYAASELAQVALDPEGARAVSGVLGPLFALSTILFIVRIVMTWYPSVPYTKLPWVIAYAPTEPLLKPTRALVPPVGGVDVSPIIWVGGISFMNEILLGKQGLLVLLASKSLGTVG